MKKSEVEPYLIYTILFISIIVAQLNWKLFEFWQPIIDNVILLIFLTFMLIRSYVNKWHWFSKRISFTLIFLLLLNTYVKLFGMDMIYYKNLYFIPLVSLVFTITITSIAETFYKLYLLWKDGKIKLY